MGKVIGVKILGRGFYEIEFEVLDVAARVLQQSPITLWAAWAFFRPWRHGSTQRASHDGGGDRLLDVG